jgi:hypothetical protein
MLWSIRCTFCLLVSLGWLHPEIAVSDEPTTRETKQAAASIIREYKSSSLRVRTDLPQADAELLYARLEQTLQFAARYWGREPKGQIECYVVHDLAAWTDAQLPHRLARVIINGVGGATVPKVVGTGKQSRNRPTVFASSKPGVAEHEVIHAYCIHTFGSSGPEWYKEGMAEMVVNRSTRDAGILCSAQQIETLRAGDAMSLATILTTGSTGQRIFTSLSLMMDDPATQGQHVSADAWTNVDADNVAAARDEYLHSWAFCYMMLHNPNYSKRFHSLGNAFVADQRVGFDDFFASARDKIEFEHQLFLKHVSIGYRVDLCAWDWSRRFTTLEVGRTHKTCVVAGKGFQPSGVTVTKGQRYAYEAEGRWSLSAEGRQIDADGDGEGAGRLFGVVLNDRTLSEPFPLGTNGTLVSPTSGKLYLRCSDAWNELADNTGQLNITISSK